MALTKKSQFQLDVLAKHGVFPVFEGAAPEVLADPTPRSGGRKFKAFCRSVLEREPDAVWLLAVLQPDEDERMASYKAEPIKDELRTMLEDHRNKGRESARKKLAPEIEALKKENARLTKTVRGLTERNDALLANVRRGSAVQKGLTNEKLSALLTEGMSELLASGDVPLDPLVGQNIETMIQVIGETKDVTAGLTRLFAFVNSTRKAALSAAEPVAQLQQALHDCRLALATRK